jgi:hypothetical protein
LLISSARQSPARHLFRSPRDLRAPRASVVREAVPRVTARRSKDTDFALYDIPKVCSFGIVLKSLSFGSRLYEHGRVLQGESARNLRDPYLS